MYSSWTGLPYLTLTANAQEPSLRLSSRLKEMWKAEGPLYVWKGKSTHLVLSQMSPRSLTMSPLAGTVIQVTPWSWDISTCKPGKVVAAVNTPSMMLEKEKQTYHSERKVTIKTIQRILFQTARKSSCKDGELQCSYFEQVKTSARLQAVNGIIRLTVCLSAKMTSISLVIIFLPWVLKGRKRWNKQSVVTKSELMCSGMEKPKQNKEKFFLKETEKSSTWPLCRVKKIQCSQDETTSHHTTSHLTWKSCFFYLI